LYTAKVVGDGAAAGRRSDGVTHPTTIRPIRRIDAQTATETV